MADDISRLLHHIARHYTGTEEMKDVELDDPAIAAADLDAGRSRALKEEQQRADELDDAFRDGLTRAHAAHQAGGDAISLDDRDPEENRIADALVHFLVGPGMAVSRTRETAHMHYIYTIWVDWDRLEQVASEASIDLGDTFKQAQ